MTQKVSVAHWCAYHSGKKDKRMESQDLALFAAEKGVAIELPPLRDVPLIRSRGIAIPAHLVELGGKAPGFRYGFANEQRLVEDFVFPAIERVFEVAEDGEHCIVFAGTLDEHELVGAHDRLIANLETATKMAEKAGRTIVFEHLNSKGGGNRNSMFGHDGYFGDDLNLVAGWIRKVRQRTGSNALNLLFDVYHVEVMHPGRWEELLRGCYDIIKDGHIHTAGVQGGKPTRCRLKAPGQDIDYERLVNVLEELKYNGYVGLENIFGDDEDPEVSMTESIQVLTAS